MNQNMKDEGRIRKKVCFKKFYKNKPLISVVTVVYNGENHIEQTIKTILSQTYQNIEYIIIDGNSTDNTLNIINQYKDQINCVVSEPDNGIADAMNKGILKSTGDFLIFLQADDYFFSSHVLDDVVGYINNDRDILLAGIKYGKDLKSCKSRGFNFGMNFKTGIFHQGAICHKSVFERTGVFDTNLKIAMDYDFFLRAYRNGIKVVKVPLFLSVMRDTGISSQTDWLSLSNRFKEEKVIHDKNCSSWGMRIIYSCYWLIYFPYRRIRYILTRGFN